MEQNIEKTTDEGLCTACGICAAVCPTSCISFERRKETYEPGIDHTKCIKCGKCLRVCPGYSYTYQTKMREEPVCFTVRAKDNKILKNASSGGLITAMVSRLLQDGQYQTAFLVMNYAYGNQVGTQPVHMGDSLCNSQQSRYLPVSQEKAVKYILENPQKKVIFIGTSCAVHGLCNALKAVGRNRENVLVFGLFCDQIMTYSIYEYMKKLKSWSSPVSAVHFRDKRAGGWPGNIRIEFQDGTYEHLSAKERMLVKDFCRQKRCLYCMDKLNVDADLSAGDNYTGENASREGANSLIIRTEQGWKTWECCENEFETYPADYDRIKKSQHIDKKMENQLMNNLIYAEAHRGRKVENNIPDDLLVSRLEGRIVMQKDRKRLEKQLEELALGERGEYSIIRKKRAGKLRTMYWNGIMSRLGIKNQ